jgi:TBC1 domain family member 5
LRIALNIDRERWRALFDTSVGVDLREAVREGSEWDPCEQGLRSVCWKSFLLYGPISQSTWPKKLAEGRSAYGSLRDHFLRFIDNPNDVNSLADPLADDEASPWSNLRNDEASREEIFQDVTRTNQENFFFREPSTQRKLLDILFIYSKLNPDTGYRQGMHELLAPILWVVNQDALDASNEAAARADKKAEGTELMLAVLDRRFVEHDAFNLFCAVMQNAKASYEIGENRDASPMIKRSKRIGDDLLTIFDPELALHLQVVGVLPQIYTIRWIRLLFGREFEFKDVLKMWDVLFAEGLRTDIVDMTCIAMLLRIRWYLVDADYTTAITSISKYSPPNKHESPRVLVRDAIFLDANRDMETGMDLILRYTGRKPRTQKPSTSQTSRLRADITPRGSRSPQHRPSPGASPARFAAPQKQLEAIFQQVSGGIQQRTEGWNSVSKAVRGAVGEVKRNMALQQNSHSRQSSVDGFSGGSGTPRKGGRTDVAATVEQLEHRLSALETRNKALSKMLEGALTSLRSMNDTSQTNKEDNEEAFNVTLAKIQFVSVYLADSEIPIPQQDEDMSVNQKRGREELKQITQEAETAKPPEGKEEMQAETEPKILEEAKAQTEQASVKPIRQLSPSPNLEVKSSATRPSLAESSFSFMLGENRHRSSFVSSVSDLPEQRRDSESKARPKQLWAEEKEKDGKQRKGSAESEDDGFTMSSLRGGGGGGGG